MGLVEKLRQFVRREYLRAVSNAVFVGIFSVPRYTQQHPEEQPLVEPYDPHAREEHQQDETMIEDEPRV